MSAETGLERLVRRRPGAERARAALVRGPALAAEASQARGVAPRSRGRLAGVPMALAAASSTSVPPLLREPPPPTGPDDRPGVVEERGLAARTAGALYLLGALVGTVQLALPGATITHPGATGFVVGVAAGLGLVLLRLGATHRSEASIGHLAAACGVVLLTAGTYLTGGPESPARVELVLVVAFAAAFLPVRAAALYGVACVAAYAAPLAYASDEADATFAVELLGAAATYAALGTVIVRAKQLLVAGREHAQDQARTDSLTGLANRRALLEILDRQARGRRTGDSLGLLLLDLDDLKLINTRCGHPGGDEALRQVAGALRRSAREGDTVARLGGDEFAIAVSRADAEGMRVLADRVRAAVARVEDVLGKPGCQLRVSSGWAILPEHASSVDALLARADDGLRAAKAEGKDRSRGPV